MYWLMARPRLSPGNIDITRITRFIDDDFLDWGCFGLRQSILRASFDDGGFAWPISPPDKDGDVYEPYTSADDSVCQRGYVGNIRVLFDGVVEAQATVDDSEDGEESS